MSSALAERTSPDDSPAPSTIAVTSRFRSVMLKFLAQAVGRTESGRENTRWLNYNAFERAGKARARTSLRAAPTRRRSDRRNGPRRRPSTGLSLPAERHVRFDGALRFVEVGP